MSIETYLNDPVIKDHLDRRLVLIAQLLGSAQGQVVSSYWELCQHGKVGQSHLAEANKLLNDVKHLLETV